MFSIKEEGLIEITDNELKVRFLKILDLLVRWDTYNLKTDLNSDHFTRAAISKAIPESLQLWIKDKGENLFYVSAHYETDWSSLTFQWIVEDHIISERKEYENDPDHPIHKMDCMTDIYKEVIQK